MIEQVESRRLVLGENIYESEMSDGGVAIGKEGNFPGRFKEFDGQENERKKFLYYVGDNGVKWDQAKGLARRQGMEGPYPIEGIGNFQERAVMEELINNPNVDKFDIPGYISQMKALEAIHQGKFNPEDHENTIFYTNDAMRIVIDDYGHMELLGKPKTSDEVMEQLEKISGNRTIDIVGSTIIDEYGNMKTHMVYIVNEFHHIPYNIRSDIASDPKTFSVAGSLSILTSTGRLSGIEAMKNDFSTEIWTKELGQSDEDIEFFGYLKPGVRFNRKYLLNIILGGGYPLGMFVEEEVDRMSGEIPNKYWFMGSE